MGQNCSIGQKWPKLTKRPKRPNWTQKPKRPKSQFDQKLSKWPN